jgi:gamma-glutamyltranspeptidase/glutathione hydrolase
MDIKTDHGTSNITVTDSDGLVLSVTVTVGMPFGSRVITEHGIVLNDTMADFSIEGKSNWTGYEPGSANYSEESGLWPLNKMRQ